MDTIHTGLPGIRSLQVGRLHCPGCKGTEDEAHVFVGQRQWNLRVPCEKKSRRFGVSHHFLCHSRLWSLCGSGSLVLPQKYIFVPHFPSQKMLFHYWSSQICLFRTQVHFLRRGAHFPPLSGLHFKNPRQILVNAAHGPERHNQWIWIPPGPLTASPPP